EIIELSVQLDKSKALAGDAEKKMSKVEPKVSTGEAKLVEVEANYACLIEQVEKLRAKVVGRSRREEEIIKECKNDILLVFKELKRKTFKEGWDVALTTSRHMYNPSPKIVEVDESTENPLVHPQANPPAFPEADPTASKVPSAPEVPSAPMSTTF
ncbi:unnamed protein product, partial [Ilex paraguariensis]